MLQALRDKRHWAIRILLAIVLVGLMVGFGVDIYQSNPIEESSAAATVDGEEISYEEFLRAVEQTLRMYRSQLGPNFDKFRGMLNVERQVLDQLIDERLLARLTTDLGLSASMKQIEEKILESPFFTKGYSRETYIQYLQALGMSGEQLEAMMRQDIVHGQLLSILTDLNVIGRTEIRTLYEDQERRYQFRYLTFDPKAFEGQVKEDAAKLASYFEAHREEYRTPKRVSYAYAQIRPEDFLAKVNVTDDDLRSAYEERMNEFVEPREYALRLIAIGRGEKATEASTLDSEEARRKRAEDVVERLKSGEGFDRVAEEVSEEKGTLKWSRIQDLPPQLAQAVQDLDRGEFTGVIEMDRKFVIARLEDVKEPRQRSFEEVRQTLDNDLRVADAPLYAHAEAQRLHAEWENSKFSLEEFGREKSLPVRITEKPVAPGDSQELLELTSRVIDHPAASKELVEFKEIPTLVEVRESFDPLIPPLEEIRTAVLAEYVRTEAKLLARQVAEDARAKAEARVEEEKPSNEVPILFADKEGLQETKLETRTGHAESFLGRHPDVFSLTSKSPILKELIEEAGVLYAVQLKTVVPAPTEQFAAKEGELLLAERRAAGNRLYRTVTQALRANSNIWINPDALDSSRS